MLMQKVAHKAICREFVCRWVLACFSNSIQEKEFHSKEVAALEKQNSDLKQEVAKLLKDPKTNVRQQMFPEFFPTQEK